MKIIRVQGAQLRKSQVDYSFCLQRVVKLGAGKGCLCSELLFDAQQLVVLGEAFTAAWRACLELSGAQSDGQVCDKRVLRFTAPV